MFNKPGVFNRNDPITKRDVRPVLGSGSSSSSSSGSAGSVKEEKDAPESATTGQSPASSGASASASASAGTPVAAQAEESLAGASLIVGPDVKLKGAEILDCDTLVVEGRVEATMDSRVVRIAEKGSFSGKVSIDIAEIHGTFEGELTARTQLTIHSTGRVNGKIRYGKLVIEEGGELCGEVSTLAGESALPVLKQRVEPFVAISAAAG